MCDCLTCPRCEDVLLAEADRARHGKPRVRFVFVQHPGAAEQLADLLEQQAHPEALNLAAVAVLEAEQAARGVQPEKPVVLELPVLTRARQRLEVQ